MKPSLFGVQPFAVALLALSSLGSSLFAQTTATTTPVGFITVTVPAAANATTPSSKAISIPLYNAAAFASAIASVDGSNSFTLTGANWTANQFTTTPHFVRVRSGAQVGRFFLISSHTTNRLTVDTHGENLTTLLSVNDSCEIIPANTLGSIFGTTTPIVQTGATAEAADRVFLWNGTDWDTFFHNGTEWRKTTSTDNQNGVVIYPDEGLLVSRRASTPLDLTFLGAVPTTTEKTELAGGTGTFVANRFPVDIQLSNLGIHQTAGWKSGATANVADNVMIWNGSIWEQYFYNGTNWKKSSSLKNQDTTAIAAGTSIFIKRTAATSAIFAQTPPYTP